MFGSAFIDAATKVFSFVCWILILFNHTRHTQRINPECVRVANSYVCCSAASCATGIVFAGDRYSLLTANATLNTVNNPPFRTEVSNLNAFFLVTSSLTCLGVSSVINPWIVPDHSPSTITRTDRNSWSPLTTHIFANYFFLICAPQILYNLWIPKNPSSAHIRRTLLIIYAPISPDCFEKGDQFFFFYFPFFQGC